MIVSEIMVTKMITVQPDDTLSHAANLLRQYQFHHLPVVRQVKSTEKPKSSFVAQKTLPVLEGMVPSNAIDLAVALGKQRTSGEVLLRPWQEQRVAEIMHRTDIQVSPTTNVGAAAQILVERGINCLPVIEYEQVTPDQEPLTVLVGLLTRSDILIAFARAMGVFEPGTQLLVDLPPGDLKPLAQTLLLAGELHIQIHSVMLPPQKDETPRKATLRLGTINPFPLLARIQEEKIPYSVVDPL